VAGASHAESKARPKSEQDEQDAQGNQGNKGPHKGDHGDEGKAYAQTAQQGIVVEAAFAWKTRGCAHAYSSAAAARPETTPAHQGQGVR
jgi:NifU-like protein involved in Fe-S cluster formation